MNYVLCISNKDKETDTNNNSNSSSSSTLPIVTDPSKSTGDLNISNSVSKIGTHIKAKG